MGEKSKIEWTDVTWNPVRGCDKISPGCKNCYAETFAERFRGVKGHPYEQGFDLRLVPEKLPEPLTWRRPRRVFVNSMSDLFHEGVPFEFIAAVFGIMSACSRHTFQVLTKRAARARDFFRYIAERGRAYSERGEVEECFRRARQCDDWEAERSTLARSAIYEPATVNWPLPNVWLGVSVENQKAADERIPILLQIPAAVRFLSVEPLLGPVDLRRVRPTPPKREPYHAVPVLGDVEAIDALRGEVIQGRVGFSGPRIDWCIVGGESGPGARPCDVGWVRSIVEQCKAASVPCFVKQLGSPLGSPGDRKGGNPDYWPADIRVREFPGDALRPATPADWDAYANEVAE